MNLMKWDPFRELEDMSNRLNRMFARGELARTPASEGASRAFDWAPSVDVIETAEAFLVKAELPGVKKDDVKVAVDAGVLRIEGERKQEQEEKDKKYHRIERSYGSFRRVFTLPTNVDATKLMAEFKDGVLNVMLPKSAQSAPRAIEVKVA
jgi:HSP20 family protein